MKYITFFSISFFFFRLDEENSHQRTLFARKQKEANRDFTRYQLKLIYRVSVTFDDSRERGWRTFQLSIESNFQIAIGLLTSLSD